MPARPKQQHYVTRAYLQGFLEPRAEHLFCYGRHRQEPFQQRSEELARERNYYSVRREDGTWDDSLEHEIEQRVELPGLAVVRKLDAGNTRLVWPERNALSMLMAVQRFRVPHLRQMMDTVHQEMVHRLLEEHDRLEQERGPGRLWIRSVSPVRRESEPERPRTYVTREELQQIRRSLEEDPGQFSRESLFSMAVSFAQVFRYMKWSIYRCDDAETFMTSDCPVLMRHERGDIEHAGLVRPDTKFEFPISRSTLLVMTHDIAVITRLNRMGRTKEALRILNRIPEIQVLRANAQQVRTFNQHQVEYCSRWAFSGTERKWIVESLQAVSKNVTQRLVRDNGFYRFEALTGG